MPLLVILALAGMVSGHHAPRLIWNLSNSAPLGLYRVRPGRPIGRGDWVIMSLPTGVSRFAAERRYVGDGVPILKQVAAQAGDRVCARGESIAIDDHLAVARQAVDRNGRVLPHWTGCRLLRRNQIFLINRMAMYSFDSRYFGPLSRDLLLGRVEPIWTWGEG